MTEWVVTDLEITDRSAWERLYVGYGDFYETSMPPTKLATRLDVVARPGA